MIGLLNAKFSIYYFVYFELNDENVIENVIALVNLVKTKVQSIGSSRIMY